MKLIIATLFCVFAASHAAIDWDNLYHMEQVLPLPGQPEEIKPTLGGRIVGGEVALQGKYPYQVGLFLQLGNQQAFCGGSLISPNYVLTAAHCVEDISNFTVVLGTVNIKKNDASRVDVQTSKAVIHPEWSRTKLRNDIAIISLPSPVKLNDNIQLVRLPKKSDVGKTYEGQQSTITGWGKDSDKATSVSEVLRLSQNHILTNKKCGSLLLGMQIPETQICQSGKGKRGACSGDSGGPLVTEEADGKPVQIGLTSYGLAFGCALGLPTSYTRTTEYLDWIVANSDAKLRD